MSFFFVETPLIIGTRTEISGEVAHHISGVRRMKVGDLLELQDSAGTRFIAQIDEVQKRALVVTPLREGGVPLGPHRDVTLLQAYIAEQRLDLILQKTTELGAARIIVWQAEHSPHEIAADRIGHKTERFVAILKNACEQSGRPDVPALSFAASLEVALEMIAGETPVLLDAGGTSDLHVGPLALIVGPEGGFSNAERYLCDTRQIPTLSLGTYTLRAETAAIAGLARALS
jgi:16S rRNA (uracil1498-N3)-methyltransferase